MHRWTRGIMGDDPPYLTVGTEVSAKYKGAFCEAKVRKVVRSVKCKVTFKLGLGSAIVADDQVRGTLRVGSTCEVKHPEKKEFSEAILNKIQDCSQYTVVFDDGDITTLRRSALCLKSGRHFAESETLDQLPLTHPEHFSSPVVGGRKGRRSRQAHEESSEEEGTVRRGKRKEEKEEDIGRTVCVELGDKKKQKDNWFPGLVVAPTAQDTVRIKVRDEYLVRSFKDGRYFTVPKKEATEFTREIGARAENNSLKTAVEKALLFLDRDELPPHWDRDLLFGVDEGAASDSDGAMDSDGSDDEPREEKDHFVAQLYKFMDDRGTPINGGPAVGDRDVDLYRLFKVVHKLGGYNRVTNHNQWRTVSHKVGFGQGGSGVTNLVKQAYKKFLHSFEEFYRKLGCTMVNHPRGNRARQHAGRSLIRDRDRATPVNVPRDRAGPSADGGTEGPVKELGEGVVKLEETLAGPLSEDEGAAGFDETPKEVASKRDEKLKPTKKEVCLAVEEIASPPKSIVVKEELSVVRVVKKERVVDLVVNKAGPSKESIQSDASIVLKGKQIDDVREDCGIVEKSPVLSRREEKAKEDTKTIKPKEEKPKSIQHKSDRIKVLGERTKVGLKEENVEVIEKVKEEVKEETLKTSEDEKSDKSIKKRLDKKEDEEKQTRSKSKEDLFLKKDMITPERRSRDFEKRLTPRLKKAEEEDESLTKRGRKRKEMESKPNPEEGLGQLGSNIAVGVGDKLKVYYGPTHESKVTYEAKVIDMEKDTFLVHYTGWNTRYDEWIKRGRIAENLSWTPSRAKRLKQQQGASKTVRPFLGKRGRPSTSGRDSATHRPRSATPSSVTSSSSRTKSPGTPAPRSARPHEYRRRTRRTSGHTDASVASGSESESDSGQSEPGAEPVRTRSRSERLGDRVGRDEGKRPPRKFAGRRKDVTEVEAEDEREEDGGDRSTETDVSGDPRVVETRRSKRTRKTLSVVPSHKEGEQKREPSTESEEEQQQQPPSKGRDFDLNQIRSELKGIEKAVKQPPQDVPATDVKEPRPILDDKTGLIDDSSLVAEVAEQSKPSDEVVKICSPNTSTDDIYEFKEPEPFDFEVRSKRDLLLPEEKPKLNRKQAVKLVDEVVEAKIEKPVTVRKKLVRNALPKTEVKDAVPQEGVVRKRFRRNVAKSIDTPVEVKKKEVELSRECSPEPSSSQKNISVSACEEAFDKLCESPVFRPASQPRRTPSPTLGPSIEPLSLFSELPGEGKDNGGDDSEDRLVISETEETETELEGPLFTYPQRHHEELLPTLPVETLVLPVEVSDQSQNAPRIQSSVGGFSTFGKNVGTPSAKSVTLRKKSSIPVIDKKASKLIANKKEISMTSKRKELCQVSIQKESEQTVSKKEASQITKKDLIPSISEDESEADTIKGEVSPVNKPEATPITVVNKKEMQTSVAKKESTPVVPKKELNPVVSKKESTPIIPKKESSPVVSRKNLSPVVPKKELSPVVPRIVPSPIVINTETSPSVVVKEAIPVVISKTEPNILPIKEISSVITKKESAPIIHKKESSPVPNKKGIGLNLGKKESSPTIKKSSITTINKKESSPIARRKDSSPINKKKDLPTSVKKKEAVLVMKEEEETILKEPAYSSPHSRLASDNSIEADEEMYADDPISAAIQRVISQAMTDEDSNDFDVALVVTSPPNVHLELKSPKVDALVPMSESQKKDNLKRKSGGRKPVLSQEFVEDSDSDSSDGEQRLVIAKTDDDDSRSRLGEESSSSQSLPKPSTFKESHLLQALDNSQDKMLSTKEDIILNKDDSSMVMLIADDSVSFDKKPITEDSNSKLVEEVVKLPSLLGIDKSTTPVEVSTTKKDSELLLELCDLGSNVCGEVRSLGALADVKDDDNDCSVPSLLCEETIPGSPTPMSESAHEENAGKEEPVESRTAILEMPFASAPSCSSSTSAIAIPPVAMELSEAPQASLKLPESMSSVLPGAAAPVIENTPPTTPDSSLSITSGSPTEERAGMSPTMDNESVKSRRDSFEGDSSGEGNKVDNYSDEDSLLNIELSNSSDNRLQGLKSLSKKLGSDLSPSKKRRRSRKRSECDSNKRLKTLAGQSNRLMGGGGSDSDDTSENSTPGCLPLSSSENMLPARSPRPSKYNFYVELDPELDGSQRIALLQQKLQELRKTYVNVKAELACIDRRRKKLRRREREDKATKSEVVCS